MQSTKETQTEPHTELETHLSLWGPCSESSKQDEENIPGTYFDSNNKKHVERLQDWCRVHWQNVFKRSMQSSNSIYYHGCCNSFSRRHFVKVAGHISLATCSLRKIPSFKGVNSPEDLYRWLLNLIMQNSQHGKLALFPTINKYHTEEISSEEECGDKDEYQSLKKRVESIQSEIDAYKSQLEDLQRDNASLLCSSKNWYKKYNDLLEQQEKQDDINFQTPVKSKLNRSFEFFSESH